MQCCSTCSTKGQTTRISGRLYLEPEGIARRVVLGVDHGDGLGQALCQQRHVVPHQLPLQLQAPEVHCPVHVVHLQLHAAPLVHEKACGGLVKTSLSPTT